MAIRITRRRLLNSAARTGICVMAGHELFAASDFWNKKEPSSWSSSEVLELATRSPWATNARVLPKPGKDRGHLQADAPIVGGGRSAGRGTGPEPVVQVTE